MADKIQKLKVFGKEIDVVEVGFDPTEEHFNRYKLADGSVIRVKAVVTSVKRIHDQFGAEGEPIYLVFTSPATHVESSTITQHDDTELKQ
jgi:hypothetical protein